MKYIKKFETMSQNSFFNRLHDFLELMKKDGDYINIQSLPYNDITMSNDRNQTIFKINQVDKDGRIFATPEFIYRYPGLFDYIESNIYHESKNLSSSLINNSILHIINLDNLPDDLSFDTKGYQMFIDVNKFNI